MAMQTGMSFSRIFMLAGAGYTGTILVKNGKLSDVLGELQSLLKGLEKSGEQDGESDLSDAVAAQVRRLAMEVRQLASSRQITVLNGHSGGGANATSLIIPAATLGALGYGYMWWKGLSFSDLMYVTKKSMAAAVSNLTKHLEHVTDALSLAKKHLTQRILDLTDKVEKQNVLSKDIKKNVSKYPSVLGWVLQMTQCLDSNSCSCEIIGCDPAELICRVTLVEEACEDLSKVEHNLKDLQSMIYCLDGKIDSLGYKQDITNIGMYYLCSFVDGKKAKLPENVQDQLKLGDKACRLLKVSSPMGLKEISDTVNETLSQSGTDSSQQDGIINLDGQQRLLSRFEL
ncbi:hypothetical protein JRO89_XS05G0058700 [Xanthoceras sorbifolium]|uniref:DUF1664 domain-containing protein n=1 Tax=Xanthoceras sorbifolium TaxID=99658 RepID=A0ABQ8I0M7_9ROSI|nr:hypothetical protein JRO89_XS05G0058700 [Xanthoceras sorbifolium]